MGKTLKLLIDAGGSLTDSQLVEGVAFKKTFSYAGFDMQPKKFDTPRIALLNIELEVKSVRENAEIRVSNLKDYQVSSIRYILLHYKKILTSEKFPRNFSV